MRNCVGILALLLCCCSSETTIDGTDTGGRGAAELQLLPDLKGRSPADAAGPPDGGKTEGTGGPDLRGTGGPDLPTDAAVIPDAPADTGGELTESDICVDCGDPPLCPDVPAPAPVSSAPLAAMDPPGQIGTTMVDGFTDDYLWDGTGYLKIGTRREWGSTVIFFGIDDGSPGMNKTNVIDANDTGREVQIALYDPDRIMQGCAWNASCKTGGQACPGSITFLGWNPVQGGNQCNNGSGTDWVNMEPGVLEAGVQPLHWNPDWMEQGCVDGGCSDPNKAWLESDVFYTQRLRFIHTHLVEMSMHVQNLSDMNHEPTGQEFPTVYATYGKNGTANLNVLLNSEGEQIPIDEPANDGFFHKIFESPGTWCALQNGNLEYGVGIYYENRMKKWQGWQKDGVFNNVRSQFAFGLPGNGTVQARAYLALGSYQTIANIFAELDGQLPPFGHLDNPPPDSTLLGSVPLSGWALDNKGVDGVTVLLDGEPLADLAVDKVRADVCKVWPGYEMCDTVGFEGVVDLSTASPCAHLLEIRATDTDGNQRIIARQRVFVAAQ